MNANGTDLQKCITTSTIIYREDQGDTGFVFATPPAIFGIWARPRSLFMGELKFQGHRQPQENVGFFFHIFTQFSYLVAYVIF